MCWLEYFYYILWRSDTLVYKKLYKLVGWFFFSKVYYVCSREDVVRLRYKVLEVYPVSLSASLSLKHSWSFRSKLELKLCESLRASVVARQVRWIFSNFSRLTSNKAKLSWKRYFTLSWAQSFLFPVRVFLVVVPKEKK